MAGKFYIVGKELELKDGKVAPTVNSLTTNLEPLYKANPLFIDSLDKWISTVLDNRALQIALKIILTEATKDDLKAYGAQIDLIEANDIISSADAIAEQAKLVNKKKMVDYFSKAITTEQEATEFLGTFQISGVTFSRWIETVLKDSEDTQTAWSFSPVAAQAFVDAWSKAAKTTTAKKLLVNSAQYKKTTTWI